MTAVRLWADAESGTSSGTTVTAANSCNPTGGNYVGGINFDTVTIGTGAALTFGTQAAHGGFSYLCTGASTGAAFLEWGTTMGTQTEIYGRLYLYLTANPASQTQIMRVLNGATKEGAILISSTGKVQVQDSTATTVSSTNSVTLNGWNRIEFHFKASTTVGVMTAVLYKTKDSFVSDETVTASGTNTGTQITKIDFGCINQVATTLRLDGIAVTTDTAYPGPTFLEQSAYADYGIGASGTSPGFFASTKTGSMLVVAVATGGTATVSSVIDSQSNTYTKAVSQSSVGAGDVELWYALNTTLLNVATGDNITVTVSNTLSAGSVVIREYSNIETGGALDQTASATGTASSAVDSGATATTTAYPEVWIGVAGSLAKNDTYTAGSGWNNAAFSIASVTYPSLAMQDQTQNALGTADSAMTASASISWVGLVATFQCKAETAELTGTGAGAGSATATLTAAATLTSTAAGVGSASSTLKAAVALTATAAGIGSASSSWTALEALTASAGGLGSATGTWTALEALTGSATGVGSASATAAQTGQLTGVASGIGWASGAWTAIEALTAAGAGQGSASGTVAEAGQLSAVAGGIGSASSELLSGAGLAGTAGGVGSGAADLTVAFLLSGVAGGAGFATALLSVAELISGVAGAIGTGSASLLETALLSSTAGGVGAASADLTTGTELSLSGTGAGIGSAGAALSEFALLTGSGAAIGNGVALIGKGMLLSGSGAGVGSGSASLSLMLLLTGTGAGSGGGIAVLITVGGVPGFVTADVMLLSSVNATVGVLAHVTATADGISDVTATVVPV